MQRLKIKLNNVQEELAAYGGERFEVQQLKSEMAKQQQEYAAENRALKMELAELKKEMEKEIEAQNETRTTKLKSRREELEAYGGERQAKEAELETVRALATTQAEEIGMLQIGESRWKHGWQM